MDEVAAKLAEGAHVLLVERGTLRKGVAQDAVIMDEDRAVIFPPYLECRQAAALAAVNVFESPLLPARDPP